MTFQMIELVAKVFRLFVKVILFLQGLTEQFVILSQQNRHLVDEIAFVFFQRGVPLLKDVAFIIDFTQFHIEIGDLIYQ